MHQKINDHTGGKEGRKEGRTEGRKEGRKEGGREGGKEGRREGSKLESRSFTTLQGPCEIVGLHKPLCPCCSCELLGLSETLRKPCLHQRCYLCLIWWVDLLCAELRPSLEHTGTSCAELYAQLCTGLTRTATSWVCNPSAGVLMFVPSHIDMHTSTKDMHTDIYYTDIHAHVRTCIHPHINADRPTYVQ